VSWISFISGLVKLASFLAQMARDRGLITNAQKAQLADLLVEQAEEIDRGSKARLKQRLADAGGVSDADEDRFRRE